VETTVAMELAASCQPLENSKASVRAMTAKSREKLGTGADLACAEIEERFLASLAMTDCVSGLTMAFT
jgi:hypothetical protein